jgi:hypothetical protein
MVAVPRESGEDDLEYIVRITPVAPWRMGSADTYDVREMRVVDDRRRGRKQRRLGMNIGCVSSVTPVLMQPSIALLMWRLC